jgi:hypothetical protein
MDIYTGAHRCAIGAPPMSDGNPRVANRMFFVADASKRHKTRLSAPRKTSESEIARPSTVPERQPEGGRTFRRFHILQRLRSLRTLNIAVDTVPHRRDSVFYTVA